MKASDPSAPFPPSRSPRTIFPRSYPPFRPLHRRHFSTHSLPPLLSLCPLGVPVYRVRIEIPTFFPRIYLSLFFSRFFVCVYRPLFPSLQLIDSTICSFSATALVRHLNRRVELLSLGNLGKVGNSGSGFWSHESFPLLRDLTPSSLRFAHCRFAKSDGLTRLHRTL